MTEEAFRLKVTFQKGEVHIHGNRVGLKDLANTCAAQCPVRSRGANAGEPCHLRRLHELRR